MPDGNPPSARVPTPTDDSRKSSPPANEASAPSRPATPSVPQTHQQRLQTLLAELDDARFSWMPLDDLLRSYDEELQRIHDETQRNGGLSPLTAREQELFARVEASRETLTETRTDDPRAKARELHTRIKAAATNPALLKGLRNELTYLKWQARQDGLTRELQRDPRSDLSALDDALTVAERKPVATASKTSAPATTTPPPPSSSPTPSVAESTVDDAQDTSILLARQERALKAHLERVQQELAKTSSTATTVQAVIHELGQAPEIEIRGGPNPFSSTEELEHLQETHQRLLMRTGALQDVVRDLSRASSTLESLSPDERDVLLQAADQSNDELVTVHDPLIDEALLRSRARLADMVQRLKTRPSGDGAAALESYARVVQPFSDLEETSSLSKAVEEVLSTAGPAAPDALQPPAPSAPSTPSPSPVTIDTLNSAPSDPSIATSETVTTTSEEATIQSAREELRARYAIRQQEQTILTTYRTQLRAHSWTYLQTHNPTQLQRLQTIQTQLGTSIDPSATLPPDALEAVHLQAIADVRAAHPDVTDAMLSTLLLSQAATQVAAAATLQEGLSTAALDTALGALSGAAVATITGAGLVQALSAQRQATTDTAAALAQEEASALQRATTLKQFAGNSTTTNGSGPSEGATNVSTLQQAQRASTGNRRALQAQLNVSLQQLDDWSRVLGGAAGTQARGITPAALQALAVTSPKSFLLATQRVAPSQRPPSTNEGIPFDDVSQRMRKQQTAFAKNQALTGQARTDDGIDLDQRRAAHLESMKARTKRTLPRATETRASSSTSASASSAGSVAAPLLALTATPTTPQALFADQQARMNRERDAFIGVGSSADSGYEAMFGTAEDADDSALNEEGATGANSFTGNAIDDAQDQATEQAWEAELMRQQQQDARARDEAGAQPSTGSGRPSLQQAKQASNLMKKAGGAASGTIAAILAVVLILWLNIRLVFPNPESSWRKPLEPLGKIGVVLLDCLILLVTLLQLLLFLLILFMPVLLILLPGVIIAATLLGGLGN